MLAELIDLIARIYHNRWVFQKRKMRFEFMFSIAKSAFFPAAVKNLRIPLILISGFISQNFDVEYLQEF